MARIRSLNSLNKKITSCKKCPRLVTYIENISKEKVKRFKNEKYWGKPLPGFGDPKARILIIGLAPAAHGGNRTGRMFTGDSSGDWVAKVLYENNFASQPTSNEKNDGFSLEDVYITAAVRCAPPQNKPLKEEFQNCFNYLENELKLLTNVEIIICLGKIAFDTCCKLLEIKGKIFSHNSSFKFQKWTIICSYHPSRQNTQTGRLTWKQWNDVFSQARKLL